jgi:predicted unusual protein kinase regulating ubiquinone biosynthesis (AarF/ABC1/UbiB family)
MMGMASRIDPSLREKLLKLLFDLAEGRGYEAARSGLDLGFRLDDFDQVRYSHDVARVVDTFHAAPPEQLDVGRVILEVTRRSAEAGLRPVPELALLGKGLLHMDAVGRALDPDFDPNRAVRDHAESVIRAHMWKSLSPSALMESALEAQDFARQMPGRLNRLLETASRNELRVHVDAVDEAELMGHLRRIANRIALALILASLVVGAALLMRVPTSFTLFGYPGLAMVLFGLAAAGGFGLAVDIAVEDYWQRRGGREEPPGGP